MEETEIISSLIDQQLPRGRLSGDIVERPVLLRHVLVSLMQCHFLVSFNDKLKVGGTVAASFESLISEVKHRKSIHLNDWKMLSILIKPTGRCSS